MLQTQQQVYPHVNLKLIARNVFRTGYTDYFPSGIMWKKHQGANTLYTHWTSVYMNLSVRYRMPYWIFPTPDND